VLFQGGTCCSLDSAMQTIGRALACHLMLSNRTAAPPSRAPAAAPSAPNCVGRSLMDAHLPRPFSIAKRSFATSDLP